MDVRESIKQKDAKGRSAVSHKKGYKMIARKLKIDDIKKLQQSGNLNDDQEKVGETRPSSTAYGSMGFGGLGLGS